MVESWVAAKAPATGVAVVVTVEPEPASLTSYRSAIVVPPLNVPQVN